MKTLAITMMMALSICFAFHSEARVNGSSDDDVIEIFITENINEFNPIRFPTLVQNTRLSEDNCILHCNSTINGAIYS